MDHDQSSVWNIDVSAADRISRDEKKLALVDLSGVRACLKLQNSEAKT